MRGIAGLIATGVWLATGLGSATALAQPLAPGSATPTLDVPYLPQTSLLCGGAALAMAERFWGRRGVYAEDFAALVHPELGGILTTDLAAAAGARGWQTTVQRGLPETVRATLDEGVPVVALIEVARRRYHYVVVIGWSGGMVTFHDPAGAPFTAVPESRFLTRWTGADRWTLSIRPTVPPPPAPPVRAGVSQPLRAPSLPCSPWLERALDLAATNRLDDAAELLTDAAAHCPSEPLRLRELAAVRFKQGRNADAARLAEAYLELAPGDELGWQLLGTARYLTADQDGALRAWNRIGRPLIDLIRIDGSRSIRFPVISRSLSLPNQTMVTPHGLALARRRVADLPALRHASVRFQPVPGGLAEIDAAVVERPVFDGGWRQLGVTAIRTVAQREARLEFGSLTGAGERWTAAWRWQPARPRLALSVDIPAQIGLPGIANIEGAWERFRFALDSIGPAVVEETRRYTALGFGTWLTPTLRPTVGLRLERWTASEAFLVSAAGFEFRPASDRLVLTATGERAGALESHPSYWRASARASWASGLDLTHPVWSARIGVDWASRATPLGNQPLAGDNSGWAIPLRAHPLTRSEPLAGRRIGRRIVHGGLAGDRPVWRNGMIVVAMGVFLDGARIGDAADGSRANRFYLDGGGGVRIGLAGEQQSVVRIDLARGLAADRRWALTVGVHRTWPPFQRRARSGLN